MLTPLILLELDMYGSNSALEIIWFLNRNGKFYIITFIDNFLIIPMYIS